MSAGEWRLSGPSLRPGPRGFNEAPACLPGNGRDPVVQHPVALGASMRPRHVCRGMARGGCVRPQRVLLLQ